MADKTQIDPLWHKSQVDQFADEQRNYKAYADALKKVLRKACELHAPLALVQARPKSIASFAEKAARKAHKYKDPAHQITDLCGARVIANTEDHLKAMCRFIRENFIIDEANSLDAGKRLKESEFGYLSVHFVVQVNRPEILGVALPLADIGERKAEIQLRTVLQHAWAAITHDRLYKSAFTVPVALRRLGHRVAALLEDADGSLNRFEREMQTYLGNYTAYLNPAELKQELEIQELVLQVEPDAANKPAIALRVARLARADLRLDKVIQVLDPHKATHGPLRLPILVELGTALIEQHRHEPNSAALEEGKGLLRQAMTPPTRTKAGDDFECPSDRKLRATAAAALAAASKKQEAWKLYGYALELDPDDPYILCSQLAFNLDHTGEWALIDSARPALLRAIEVCRSHVDAGLQLPRAWLAMGRLNLLLRHAGSALGNFAKAIRFYLSDSKIIWRKEDLEGEFAFLEQIQGRGEKMPEIEWIEQLLRLGLWLKHGRQETPSALLRGVQHKYDATKPVVIIVADPETHPDLLHIALDGFDGTVLRGGGAFAEPLQMWLDLLAAGVDPAKVRLLGMGGSHRFEYALALAFGAWVGLIQSSGRAADLMLRHPYWSKLPTLLPLPDDPMTAQAFVQVGTHKVSADKLEKMGRKTHEIYLRKRDQQNSESGGKRDPYDESRWPWELLPDTLKESNRAQAAYSTVILTKMGYAVAEVPHVGTALSLSEHDERLTTMAEMEHGRWNIERLKSGWRFASQKDVKAKLSPYLVSWKKLPASIAAYDIEAVRNFPEVLAEGGYQVQRPPG